MKTDVGVRGFFSFFFLFLPTEGAANATMDVEIVEHEEDSASAGRGEGGADGRAPARPSGGDGRAHARPSDAAASAARQASAGDITRMVLVGNPYGSRDLPLDGKIHHAPGL